VICRTMLMFLAAGLTHAHAQTKKTDAKDTLRVTAVSPFALTAGKTAKIILRGFKLDSIKDAKLAGATVKISSQGKSAAPMKEVPEKWGDTEMKLEVSLPASAPVGTSVLTLTGDAGATAEVRLLVGCAVPLVAEKEPNNSFKQPQAMSLPGAVDGSISGGGDVDVFRFEAKAGQMIAIEVIGSRMGSLGDFRLALYDAAGRQLAGADDASADDTDPRLEFTVAADGAYLVVVSEAHDGGGALMPYRLAVKAK